MTPKREIVLPAPFEYQRQVLLDEHRFKVLDVGRQAGKTTTCGLAISFGHGPLLESGLPTFQGMFQGKQGQWIAPTYDLADIAWRRIRAWLAPFWAELRKSDTSGKQWVEFPGGGRLQMRSADDPEKLVGDTLDFVVIDEAAKCKPGTWELVQPMLSVRHTERLRGLRPGGGWAALISTPKGRNWFYKVFKLGQRVNPDYKSWCWPSTISPLFSEEEYERYRRELTPYLFEREILARFTVGDGSFFRRAWFTVVDRDFVDETTKLDDAVARAAVLDVSVPTDEIRQLVRAVEADPLLAASDRRASVELSGEVFLSASLPIDEESRGERTDAGAQDERHLVIGTWVSNSRGVTLVDLYRELVLPAEIPYELSRIAKAKGARFVVAPHLEPLSSMIREALQAGGIDYTPPLVGLYDAPSPTDDAERAAPAASAIRSGRMRFLQSEWLEEFLAELFSFPDPDEERSCVEVVALAARVRAA